MSKPGHETFVNLKVQFIAKDTVPNSETLIPGAGVLFRDIDNDVDNNRFWNRGVITAIFYENEDGSIVEESSLNMLEKEINRRFQIQQIYEEQDFGDVKNIGIMRPENTFGIVACVPFDIRLVANELDAIHCWGNSSN